MSEKRKPSAAETHGSPESQEVRERLDKLGEKLSKKAEKASAEHSPETEKEAARESIEKHAISSKEQRPGGSEEKSQKEPVTRGHKKITYRATMKRVESKLPKYQRTFSKIINNDTVDAVSAVTAKTVARPSGILGGSLAAFLGLALVTFYANRLGFDVSPAFFIVLLFIGWFAGLLTELVYNAVKRLLKR